MFFEGLRRAADRLAQGLVRLAPPASEADLAAFETCAAHPLPRELRSFLGSFDGADLFGEVLVVGGVTKNAFRSLAAIDAAARAEGGLAPGELAFAESAAGDRFVLGPGGAVLRVDGGSGARWLAGPSLETWLDAFVAHEEPLYGPDGEFLAEVFEDDAVEVAPAIALKQAQRALKRAPTSADFLRARAEAERRLGRASAAAASFEEAAKADLESAWPAFEAGRLHLTLGDHAAARRLLTEAKRRDAQLPDTLARARDAALGAGETESARELGILLATMAGTVRLPLAPTVRAAPNRTPPAPGRTRPDRAAPRSRAGSRRAPRRS